MEVDGVIVKLARKQKNKLLITKTNGITSKETPAVPVIQKGGTGKLIAMVSVVSHSYNAKGHNAVAADRDDLQYSTYGSCEYETGSTDSSIHPKVSVRDYPCWTKKNVHITAKSNVANVSDDVERTTVIEDAKFDAAPPDTFGIS